jgi:NitT/TauT family transport system substrate-binding protein
MPFDSKKISLLQKMPGSVRVSLIAIAWLILISSLHYWVNFESGARPVVRMGYMTVLTNLAAPMLDYASKEGDGVRFTAMKFASFAEMAEALRNGNIEAAFIIAPLAIVLRQQGEDVKIVYIGNRHESTLVVRTDLHATKIDDLAGRTVAVPMRYSGHNLSIRQLAEQHGLSGQIKVVEMNPPDMPAALTAGALDAYYVGEPFAAKTLQSGNAKPLIYVEDVWPNFICNVMLVKQSFIDAHPDLVRKLVQGAARSGLWAKNNIAAAAEIAASYWNQSPELVKYALNNPSKDRVVFNRFLPLPEELQHMAKLMVRYGLTQTDKIDGLVENRFAKEASLSGIEGIETILTPKN